MRNTVQISEVEELKAYSVVCDVIALQWWLMRNLLTRKDTHSGY